MPWRKYLLITLTKKSPIFKLFTSPISLLYFPSILCLLFPFVSSPTRSSSQHFVLFEDRGSCGSQSAAQRVTRVCHVSRVLACVVTHLMLSREVTASFPGYWSGITFFGEAGTRAVRRHRLCVPLHRLS